MLSDMQDFRADWCAEIMLDAIAANHMMTRHQLLRLAREQGYGAAVRRVALARAERKCDLSEILIGGRAITVLTAAP